MDGVAVLVNSVDGKTSTSNRNLLLLLLIPFVASWLFAMRDSSAPALAVDWDRPALVFTTYMIHEGPAPIQSQPMLTPFFTFRNKGKETVRITELSPSCGCIQPIVTPKEVPPGVEGRLTLPIRTNNQDPGPREYTVTVMYDDPKPRQVTLTYKVVLPEKQIEIEPRVLMVMGRISSTDRDIITISDQRPERRDSPMKITSVVSSSSLFSAELAGQSDFDGIRRTAIAVTYSDNIPSGQHKGVITATTDDELFPALQIPVVLGDRKRPADEMASVSPDIGRVIVDVAHPENSSGTSVVFTIPSKWKFSHLETFPPQLQGKVSKTEPADADKSTVSVQLSLKELPSSGIEQGNLTLHATDGEEAEMVTVPIALVWRKP